MATTVEQHYEWIAGLFEAIEKDLRSSLEQLDGVEVKIPLKRPINLRRLFIGPNVAKYLYLTSGKHFYAHGLEAKNALFKVGDLLRFEVLETPGSDQPR